MRRIVLPLFVRRGYDEVTIDDIVVAAGISRRTFFRLFGGKDQIVSCDHEVYHLELHTHLLQHQSERSVQRAARGVALIVDSLTAVYEDAGVRAALLAASAPLAAEERRWLDRHQTTVAAFLTEDKNSPTTVEAEMAAAAIIAAVRVAVRDHLHDAGVPALERFEDGIRSFTSSNGHPVRQVAMIETALSLDELINRLTAD